jgi:hypothetical protein
MTTAPGAAQAAIMRARPMRAGRAKYQVTVFYADDTFEVSPRLLYADARRYATDRGAEITVDQSGP